MVSCISLAAKTFDDRFSSSDNQFRLLVGLKKDNMRKMERRLLKYLDFRVNVDKETFDLYSGEVERHWMKHQLRKKKMNL